MKTELLLTNNSFKCTQIHTSSVDKISSVWGCQERECKREWHAWVALLADLTSQFKRGILAEEEGNPFSQQLDLGLCTPGKRGHMRSPKKNGGKGHLWMIEGACQGPVDCVLWLAVSHMILGFKGFIYLLVISVQINKIFLKIWWKYWSCKIGVRDKMK